MKKIALSEHQARRTKLLSLMATNSICVIGAASAQTRSNDTEYNFRQDSYFWYLTGFNEPDATLILIKDSAGQTHVGISVQPKDEQAEIWHGRRLGADAAINSLAVDSAFDNTQLTAQLIDMFSGKTTVYSLFIQSHVKRAVDETILALKQIPKKGVLAPSSHIDVQSWLDEARLIKSPAEIALMQSEADISAQAHCKAMQICKPGLNEYHLEAEIQYVFARNGARHPAYTSIVGGGDNACILHYTQNNQPLQNGDLVLIDAGGELEGYAADITRTFPVSGYFTTVQASVYNIVLDAQLAALELLKPDALIPEVTQVVVEIITQGLLDLGILTGNLHDNIERLTYRQYFMHGLGHYLGLDVHDVGEYTHHGEPRPLSPGMVITVEPGIYIAPGSDCPEQFHGIGVRIEDDIVITESGNHVLTSDVPKTIADIEQLMSTGA